MGIGTIRVLVVDDSALMRRMISDLIASGEGLTVVATARDGREAIELTARLRPDVITMDIEMPVMDGLQALEQIMRSMPTPVVMLSSRTRHGAEATLRGLELGAVDFVCKPSGPISLDIAGVRDALLTKLRLAAVARILPSGPRVAARQTQAAPPRTHRAAPPDKLVLIASSTGGPRALEAILPQLPGDLPAAVLIAQHMPEGFTAAMAERLDALSQIDVSEGVDRESILAGKAIIAPGGRHMLVDSKHRISITSGPPVWGVRPAADLLMTSAADRYRHNCVGVVLTGMGQDGAQGMAAIRKAGGATIAQDEPTCVVYGMPKAAIEQGGVDVVLPLAEISQAICQALSRADHRHWNCGEAATVAGQRMQPHL